MAHVPSFVLDILDSELRSMHISMLQQIAKDYNLDAMELESKYLPTQKMQVASSAKTKVEVIRRMNPKAPAESTVRCLARIWNRGHGGQCTRERKNDTDFCGHHAKLMKEEGHLRHGRIDESPPCDVFSQNGARRKAVYK